MRRREAPLERAARELRDLAAELAEPIAARARASTSLACERAVLRLFGVVGLDRSRRPLAVEVVERFAELGPGRLAGGIALPFAVAAVEYDLPPHELALEVAAGRVDLGLEAELLHEPEKREEADEAVARWLGAAWARFDANRTARAELRDVLGDPPLPWVGADLEATTAGRAAELLAQLVDGGADLVRIPVPRDRELRRELGEELDRAEDLGDAPFAPSGSQRGLALLRTALDEAAADAGRYVRLGTRALGLAAPDQAVVAGFERLDLLYSDPIESIVEFGIEPVRAFTDHVFALELLSRSGTLLALGPGPLAVAPEMGRGESISVATRSGRALAMQAVALEVSLQGSLPAERILLGALPPDLLVDPAGLRHGLAEVELRRAVFPEHGLVFEEPQTAQAGASWLPALTAWCSGGASVALVLRHARLTGTSLAADEVRAAADAAGWLAASRPLGALRGEALEYAAASLDVALPTLRDLRDRGWQPLLEAGRAPAEGGRLGATGLVERREYHDPFAVPSEAPAGMSR